MASLRLVAALSKGTAVRDLSESAEEEYQAKRWRRRPLASLQLVAGLVPSGHGLEGVYDAAVEGKNAEDREKNAKILSLWWEVEDLGQRAKLLKAELAASKASIAAKESRLRPQREAAALAEQYEAAETELRKARLRLEACSRERELQERAQGLQVDEYENRVLGYKNQLNQEKVDVHRNATEDVLLLRLLHAEVDKWRAIALELETKADLQAKEEAKDGILLGLLNAQLFTDRENMAALRTEVQEQGALVKRLDQSVAHADNRAAELLAQREELEFHAAQTHSEREAATMRLAARESREVAHVDALKAELAEAEAQFVEARLKVEAQERTRADCQSKLLEKVSNVKATGGDVFFAKREVEETAIASEGKRNEEISKLGIAIESAQQKMEMLETTTFEQTVKMGSDIEILKGQHTITLKALAGLQAESSVKLAGLKEQISSVTATRKDVVAAAEVKDKKNFEMITKLASANEVLKARVVALQKSAATRNEEHIGERISVAAETSKFHDEKVTSESALMQQREAHVARMEALKKEKERWMTGGKEASFKDELHDLIGQRSAVLKQKAALTKEHDSLADNHLRKERFVQDRFIAYEAEAKALKGNIRNLKKTCTDLEAKVTETLTFRERAMANEELEQEIEACKVQIRHLTNVISTMKVEKGLLDGYKAKVLTEQNAVHRNKLDYLEQCRSRLMPLLRELLATAKLHGIADSSVASAEQAALNMGVQLTAAGR